MAQTVAELVVKLSVETRGFESNMKTAAGSMDQVQTRAGKLGTSLTTMGRGLLPVSAAIAAAGFAVAKAAIQFESGLAGVAKTTDFTEKGLESFGAQIRQLSTEIPVSTAELLRVAEAAGQLGVKKADLLGFTETMVALGHTTNLSSTEAATALARFNNIFGESNTNVEQLGSVLVDLGNNFATTEQEIMTMASRLAGAGKTIGLTQTETLALATALSSVGILAEAGGSAFSQVMLRMQSAVEETGTKLSIMAEVAGQSSGEFAKSFSDEPMVAIQAFVEGLERVRLEGGNTTAILQELNLDGIRVSDALRRASTAGALLGEAVKLANTAFEENSALMIEVNRRYETSGSQFQILRNKVQDIAVELGQSLVPILLKVVGAMEPVLQAVMTLVEWFGRLPVGVQAVVFGFAALLAVAGPLMLAVGMLAQGLTALGVTAGATIAIFGGLAAALVVIPALVIGAVIVYDKLAAAKDRAVERTQALTQAISDEGRVTDSALEAGIRMMDVWEDSGDVFERAGLAMSDLVTVTQQGDDIWHDLESTMDATNLAFFGTAGMAELLKSKTDGLSDSGKKLALEFIALYVAGEITAAELKGLFNLVDEAGDAFDDFKESIIATEGALIQSKVQMGEMTMEGGRWRIESMQMADSMAELDARVQQANQSTGGAYGLSDNFNEVAEAMALAAMGSYDVAQSLQFTEDQIQWVEDAATDLTTAMRDMTSESAIMSGANDLAAERAAAFAAAAEAASGDAKTAWQAMADGVTTNLADYKTAMENAISAATNFKDNVITTLERLPVELRQGAFEELKTMAPEMLAQMNDLSGPELEEFVRIMIEAGTLGGTGMEQSIADAVFGIPGMVTGVGTNVWAAFRDEILRGKSAVFAAAFDLGNASILGLKEGGGVQSPSKYAIEIGQWVYKGLEIGMGEGQAVVAEAGRFLAEAGLAGITDGFTELGDVVGAISERIEQIQWEQEVSKIATMRTGLAELRVEYSDLEQSVRNYVQVVATAISEEGAAKRVLIQAEQDLVVARRDAIMVTAEEARAINDAQLSYNNARTSVDDLRFAMDMLTFAGRGIEDMSFDSALGIAAAAVSIDRQRENADKLAIELGKLKTGTDEYNVKQRELTLANLQVEGSERAMAEAMANTETVGDALTDMQLEMAIATDIADNALSDLTQTHADSVDPTKDVEAAVLAVKDAEEDYQSAVDNTIKVQAEAKAADDKVIAKKAEIEDAERSLELATLQLALKWASHMSKMADDAGGAASSATGALNSIPSEVSTSIVVNGTAKALADVAAIKMAVASVSNALNPTSSAVNTGANAVAAAAAAARAVSAASFDTAAAARTPASTRSVGSQGLFSASGGMVNAPFGKGVNATVHGGEFILPADVVNAIQNNKQNGFGLGGNQSSTTTTSGDQIVVNVFGKASREDGDEIVEALRRRERRRGPAPFSVTGRL